MKKDFERQDFINRRKKLAEQLEDNSLLVLCAGSPVQRSSEEDYPFSPNRNYLYMTGLESPKQTLMIAKLGGQVTEYLFVERPDPYYELFNGKMDTAEEYQSGTGIANVLYNEKFDWQISRLLEHYDIRYLYMDFHKRTLDYTAYPENELAARLLHAHPYLQARNITWMIGNMRRVKSPSEIAKIRRAIDITTDGISSILKNLHDGVNEAEMLAHFNFALQTGGSTGHGFQPIVAGGANSNVLHYRDNNKDLKDGDLLLLDLGAEYGYYSADISRTFPVSGKFTELQKKYYNAVLYAQEKVLEALKPGLHIDVTLDITRDAIFEKCKEYGLTDKREDMVHYVPHGVCHYMGLDCHDTGVRELLEPGMVLAMEPGLYLPEFGFGIRIEDDVLITEDGCELLSPGIPKTVEEIEEFMEQARKTHP